MYQKGSRLGAERASKLGHLEVVKSSFVRSLLDRFDYPAGDDDADSKTPWRAFDPTGVEPLGLVTAVDGSLQPVKSDGRPVRQLSFVKTALVRIDRRAVEKIDKRMPHPVQMKALMKDSALQASTVFPLRNVRVEGVTYLDLVRNIIKDSLIIEHDGLTFDTLKWLAYRKWRDVPRRSPEFECPLCDKLTAGLAYDTDEGLCEHCGGVLFLTDMIGLHRELIEDAGRESLASAYMLVHETLLLFSVVRYMWEQGDRRTLTNVLLIKDGPLSFRAAYTKLVRCIRDLLAYANAEGCPIHLIGQEKTGDFVDHLNEIERFAAPIRRGEPLSYAILPHSYVREEVQMVNDRENEYGLKTNYGEKVFVKIDPHCHMVINVPTGEFLNASDKPSQPSDLIGLDRILATLPSLISYHNEGALIPINIANGVASLSNYPSAAVLKLFAGL